jgi:alpha-1,2-glucosyltransferase
MFHRLKNIAEMTTPGIPKSPHLLACMTTAIVRCTIFTDEYRYLVSKALKPVLGCDVAALRFLNVIASWLIVPLSYSILRLLRTRNNVSQHRQEGDKSTKGSTPKDDLGKMLDGHSALNIALFPPLFFFSALYYTDVISTLLVLLSYNVYLRQTATSMSVSRYVQTIIVGVMALFFRQTNIFWMAVFPAGLALVSALKGSEEPTVSSGAGTASAIFRNSWSKGMIYDCPVQDAEPQGLLISICMYKLMLIMNRRLRPVPGIASPCNHEETGLGSLGRFPIRRPNSSICWLRCMER